MAAASSKARFADAASRSFGELPQQRFSLRIEVRLHPLHFVRIFLIAASLETGRQAHLHLGINAARKFRIGMQIVDAAPHLEEVERVVHEFLGRNPRHEWSVIKCRPIQPAQPRCDRCARKFILQMQFHKRSEAESQAVLSMSWESFPAERGRAESPDSKSDPVGEYSIERTRSRRLSFLVRSSTGPRSRCSRRRRLAVLLTYGSACGSSPRKSEHGRTGGHGSENLRIPLRREFDPLVQHYLILERFQQAGTDVARSACRV